MHLGMLPTNQYIATLRYLQLKKKFSNRCNIRINNHQNLLVTQLLDTTDQIRRLKRHYPLGFNIRFGYNQTYDNHLLFTL